MALVCGRIEHRTGVIQKPIAIKSGTIKRTVFGGKDEKQAITEYKVLKYFADQNVSLVEVSPKTGRTHQIRIHLASIHHPVVGDALYGQKNNPFGLKHQFLHAESLEWSAADGKRLKIECGLPEELRRIIPEF